MKYRLPQDVSSATPLGHSEFVVGQDGLIDVPDGTPSDVIQALVTHCNAVQVPDAEPDAPAPVQTSPEPAAPTESSTEGEQTPPDSSATEEQPKFPDEKAELLAKLADRGVKSDKRASVATLREQLANLAAE